MDVIGIRSYPVRWRRLVWCFSFFNALILLAWLSVIAGVMNEPSEPANRVFLSYSLERLVLFFFMVSCVAAIVIAVWAIKYRQRWVETALNYLELNQSTKWILAILSIFLLSPGIFSTWSLTNDELSPYFAKVLPLLLWMILELAQAWMILAYLNRQGIEEFANRFAPIQTQADVQATKSTRKLLLFLLAALSLIYIYFQFRSYLDVRQAILIGDSWSYLYGAGLSISDPAFFSERRPWGILLIFKLLGGSQAAIEVFQLGLSTIAWLALAWSFVRSMQYGWSKFLTFVIVLGFSLTPVVQVWNHTVLSESLSISLLVVLLALLVLLSQQWRWRDLIWTCLACGLWMSIHEANTYLGLLLALIFFIFGIARTRLRAYWLLAFCILTVFAVNYQLSASYGLPRWALPLAEVITKRILPNQEYLDYFSAHGMPVTSDLMAFSGRWANSDNYAIINSAPLKKFSLWLFRDGRSVYAQFLLAHPFYTLGSPLENLDILLAGNYRGGIPIPGYSPALPGLVNEFFYPKSWFWLYLWLSLVITLVLLFALLKARSKVFWTVSIFFLLSIPMLYLAWHADALDLSRHATIANIQYHLGLWLMVLFCLDLLAANQRPKSA
jgi:hypothetical protein